MKKLALMGLAFLVVFAFTVPAMAFDQEFGGYWRTRAFTNQNFTGEDETEAMDFMQVDTRTRLYYTAIFSENLKFVNKFEFDADWGDDSSYGDIGADAVKVEVKNSYVDFTLGDVNFKVGAQGGRFGRGFLFDDDFSGAVISYEGEGVSIPFVWVKAYEGGVGKDANDADVDYYGISPTFSMGGAKVNPFGFYVMSDNADLWGKKTSGLEDLDMFYAGLNLDFNFNAGSVWLTGIYQGGEADLVGSDDSIDFSGYLAGAGFDVGMTGFGLHGQAFYASGDDDANDDDMEMYFVPKGQSYYWAEIMGYGMFDDQVSNNSPADQIGNIMVGNLGVTLSPMDKLSMSVDAWYAALAEDIMLPDGSEENELGIEVDVVLTYKLVDNLKIDLVGAYLFAGDATTLDSANDADPYEVGTRLSLSF